MQIFIHCKTTLHVSGVTAPIIRSIKNRYSPPTWPDQATLEGNSGTSSMTCTGGCGYSFWYSWWWVLQVQFLILLMMGAVTPETCRVVLQWINICILLHLLDFYSLWEIKFHTQNVNKMSEARSETNKYLLCSNMQRCTTITLIVRWNKPQFYPVAN